MKCITIRQPYALLISLGEKTLETRSWATSYRGPLAIHAAAHTPRKEFEEVMSRPETVEVWKRHGFGGLQTMLWYARPQGGLVVATVELVDCEPAEKWLHSAKAPLAARERAFGDLSAGRFAWTLRNPVRLDPGFPAKGKQGFWEFPWPIETHR